jgi:hypothetical protein
MACPLAGRAKFRVFSHGFQTFVLGATSILLAGCYTPTGDFGRPVPGIFENSILPFAGTISARARGEAASWYALTEHEKELRSRSWRFLNPKVDAPALAQMQDHGAFHKLLPLRSPDVTLYHRTIMGGPQLGGDIGYSPGWRAWTVGQPFQSLTSRYNRARNAITADHLLVPQFRLIASQVIQADYVRAKALHNIGQLTAEQRDESFRRICENANIIARVH